ncbi:MAG: DUF1997 domain-containing protein [Leptolyngbyaceae bacterium]|nr:DUF1997 domain-containing protein [Leptolyngbyaceae bacterium]
MSVRFAASQSVDMAVLEQQVPIHHYLRQPQRVVQSLVDPSRTQYLGDNTFRLRMRPINFLFLSIRPTVDMQLWADADGTVHLRSVGCKVEGIEYVNQRFQLTLNGQLAPQTQNGKTRLCGTAHLAVQVDIPPALMLTPRPIIEATGNGLLKSILLTIKQRLMHQLLVDYQRWATSRTEKKVPTAKGLRPSDQWSL